MSSLAETVQRYDEAWACADPERRAAILDEIWTSEGTYVDQDVPGGVRGRQALAKLIGQSLDEFPGLAITASSELAVLGDRAWYRWTATTAAGESFAGIDFVEFAPDGRIHRVTNFFEE